MELSKPTISQISMVSMSRTRPTTSSSSTSSWPLRWPVGTVVSAGSPSRARGIADANQAAQVKSTLAARSNTSSKRLPISNNQPTNETVSATAKRSVAATMSAHSPFPRINPTTTPVFPRSTTNPTQAASRATTRASTPVK